MNFCCLQGARKCNLFPRSTGCPEMQFISAVYRVPGNAIYYRGLQGARKCNLFPRPTGCPEMQFISSAYRASRNEKYFRCPQGARKWNAFPLPTDCQEITVCVFLQPTGCPEMKFISAAYRVPRNKIYFRFLQGSRKCNLFPLPIGCREIKWISAAYRVHRNVTYFRCLQGARKCNLFPLSTRRPDIKCARKWNSFQPPTVWVFLQLTGCPELKMYFGCIQGARAWNLFSLAIGCPESKCICIKLRTCCPELKRISLPTGCSQMNCMNCISIPLARGCAERIQGQSFRAQK